MSVSKWMRQGHRWVSMAFVLIVSAIFIALGTGREPAQWVYFLPLIPLALLTLSGLWMFFQPHVTRRRSRARAHA